MLITIKEDIPVTFGSYETTGTVLFDTDRGALLLDDPEEMNPVVLNVNLTVYGLEPESRETVFVRDYSENEGLTDSLHKAGAVEIVRAVFFGPHNTKGYEVRVLFPRS